MTRLRRSRARGFTLIELLAVMAILALLISALAFGFGKYSKRAEERQVESFLVELTSLVDGSYSVAKGDAPPDNFGSLPHPSNDVNVGSESLVAYLMASDAEWPGIDEKNLGNVDGDKFPKKVTKLESLEAFEPVDRWGNPIAYLHCKSYGKKMKMLAKPRDRGEFEEQTVVAKKSEKTGAYYRPDTCQLISAGLDGVFGTDDDLYNFQK